MTSEKRIEAHSEDIEHLVWRVRRIATRLSRIEVMLVELRAEVDGVLHTPPAAHRLPVGTELRLTVAAVVTPEDEISG